MPISFAGSRVRWTAIALIAAAFLGVNAIDARAGKRGSVGAEFFLGGLLGATIAPVYGHPYYGSPVYVYPPRQRRYYPPVYSPPVVVYGAPIYAYPQAVYPRPVYRQPVYPHPSYRQPGYPARVYREQPPRRTGQRQPLVIRNIAIPEPRPFYNGDIEAKLEKNEAAKPDSEPDNEVVAKPDSGVEAKLDRDAGNDLKIEENKPPVIEENRSSAIEENNPPVIEEETIETDTPQRGVAPPDQIVERQAQASGSLEQWSPAWIAACKAKHERFDEHSGTFVGANGKRAFCEVE